MGHLRNSRQSQLVSSALMPGDGIEWMYRRRRTNSRGYTGRNSACVCLLMMALNCDGRAEMLCVLARLSSGVRLGLEMYRVDFCFEGYWGIGVRL